jgi:high-affinity nickel-transport protein
MKGAALFSIVIVLGMRHGVDPDHLSIIDGLSRFHPSRWNGLFFAVGHGIIVTLLTIGFGKMLGGIVAPYTAWILLLLGCANLWRLWRPTHYSHLKPPRLLQSSPLLLGFLFGMGFETASQLSAILLAGQLTPWLLGLVFWLGMIMVDGTDGILAARTQQLALAGNTRSVQSSRALGLLAATVSFALAGAEFAGADVDRIALALGVFLFAMVVCLRFWSGGACTHVYPPVSENMESGACSGE